MRELLGDRVSSVELTRETLAVSHFEHPLDMREYFKERYGPTIATYANASANRERVTTLDGDLAELLARSNRGAPDGPALFDWEYLLVVARVS